VVVVAIVVVMFLAGVVLRAVGSGPVTREDAIEDWMGRGLTRDQAECMADRAEAEFGSVDPDLDDAPREDFRELMRMIVDCQGAIGEVSDCLVDGMVDVIGEDNLRGDRFIEATQELSVDDRIGIAQVGMVCGGLSEAAAECVTDAMVAEFGRDTFESPRLQLTPAQQSRVQEMSMDCAAEG
jgi:hypothetical protein